MGFVRLSCYVMSVMGIVPRTPIDEGLKMDICGLSDDERSHERCWVLVW